MPWRILVYEGDESDRLEDGYNLLRPLLNVDISIITSSYITSYDGRPRPIIILHRHD